MPHVNSRLQKVTLLQALLLLGRNSKNIFWVKTKFASVHTLYYVIQNGPSSIASRHSNYEIIS